jgi:hypothetical protein
MRDTVISLCDFSGTWSQPYRDAGYNVIQVDPKLDNGDALLWPSKRSQQPRYPREYADIADYIGRVYAVLHAPVCQYFSGSGAKHPRTDAEIIQGLALVDAGYRIATITDAKVFCMENPVGKLKKWIGEPVMRFHPSDYAGWADVPDYEAYTKRTCLWGWFQEPERKPVKPIHGSKLWRMYGGKSERTKELRSITPQGFARAFFAANNPGTHML